MLIQTSLHVVRAQGALLGCGVHGRPPLDRPKSTNCLLLLQIQNQTRTTSVSDTFTRLPRITAACRRRHSHDELKRQRPFSKRTTRTDGCYSPPHRSHRPRQLPPRSEMDFGHPDGGADGPFDGGGPGPGEARAKPLPADLPRSLDDRRMPREPVPETEMYDGWQGRLMTAPPPPLLESGALAEREKEYTGNPWLTHTWLRIRTIPVLDLAHSGEAPQVQRALP